MDRITNSIIKENFRVQNEQEAKKIEENVMARLKIDLSGLETKPVYSWKIGVIVTIVIMFIFTAIANGDTSGCTVGLLVGPIIYLIGTNIIVGSYNANIEEKINNLKNMAQDEIDSAYKNADKKTKKQIQQYDNEVTNVYKKAMLNASGIESMVQYNLDMFQRMISHSDSGSNIRFIEADFIYLVTETGICYFYDSQYTNPRDNFDFDVQRYRNLHRKEECEGLARALAKLTKEKMMTMYPPNSLNIKVSHIDAKVTMHFKAANSNFVVARDIL